MDRSLRYGFTTPTYPYIVLEGALAAVFLADATVQRTTFRARLKHLQRLGLPGVKAGKGVKIAYSLEQVCQFLIALMMTDSNVEATTAIRIIKKRWRDYFGPKIRRALQEIAREKASQEKDIYNPDLLVLRPRTMVSVWSPRKDDPDNVFWVTIMKNFDLHLKDKAGRPIPRSMVQEVVLDKLPKEGGGGATIFDLTHELSKLLNALTAGGGPSHGRP